MKKLTGKTQVNPLSRLEHGTSPAKKAPNTKSGAKTSMDGKKFVKKPLNAHRAQPGFGKYGSTGMKVA